MNRAQSKAAPGKSKDVSTRIAAPRNDAELAALLEALMPIFNMSSELAHRYAQIAGAENFRIMWRDHELVGGLAVLPMGQFFGGKSVPMTGIAVVGVQAEFRGSGLATRLMDLTVQELHAQGIALSTLYPATVPLYRRAGYELAGSKFEVRLPLRMLELSEREYAIRKISTDDHPALKAAYRARAEIAPGFLDRSEFIWKRVQAPRGEAAHGYAALNPSTREIEGYLYYTLKESPDAAYLLSLTDFTAVSRKAALRLLTFLCEHQSMADVAIWQGGAIDPVLQVLPERHAKVRLTDHWMLRIVDVGAALSRRGYPAGLKAELHLDVQDDLIVANNGRYVLEVDDGKANVCTGGNGDLKIDIRGLAALYSGFMSASQLRVCGLVEASNAAAIHHADAAFGGVAPSLCDGF